MIQVLGIFFIIAILFPLIWVGVIWLISRMGWASLAAHYGTGHSPSGERRKGRSIMLYYFPLFPTNYGFCMHIHLSKDAIYMQPARLFRFGHQTLKIPLRDIQFTGDTATLRRIARPKITFMRAEADWIKSRQHDLTKL